ncbi:MAG TPA: hypothetical protein VES67_22725 [Vicinamibacterales bacterium]|nr:hypothetical protein [Vicinamibacterales bacterium]
MPFALLIWGLAAGVVHSQNQPPARLDTSAQAVVDAASAYVKEYQDQLTYVLADEIYIQQIRNQVPLDRTMPRSRRLKSELFFMFGPADRVWMAIRDVAEVDRKPVDHRPDLRAALLTLPAPQVAGTFKTYNSRFNLGRVIRNFNEPTLSLLVLDSRYRDSVTFERKRIQRTAGTTLVTLAFSERKPPWLIRDLSLRPVFSQGELIIEAGTGRVRRAVLRAKIGSVQMELTTIYALEPRLGMWVPALFREHYEEGLAPNDARSQLLTTPAQFEDITCEAKYSNFRRFETAARIK